MPYQALTGLPNTLSIKHCAIRAIQMNGIYKTLFGERCLYPVIGNYIGGKTRHINHFEDLLRECETFGEPFCGGAAVFCFMYNHRRARRFILNDINPDLMSIYSSISTEVKQFTRILKPHLENWQTLPINNDIYDRHGKKMRRSQYRRRQPNDPEFDRRDYYYYVRDCEYMLRPFPATLLFLMQVAHNGSISNKRGELFGEFQSGCGDCTKNYIFDEENIYGWHEALQVTTLMNGDYTSIDLSQLRQALIYADPIYRNAFHYNQPTPTDQQLMEILALRCFMWVA